LIIGALTAALGASMMLAQNDIKNMLGFSTIGQMGYMMMECGLGAFSLAVFHLIAHGLFKATVFLNCGNVIGRARLEPHFPHAEPDADDETRSPLTWLTGFVTTLLIPLLILLLTHGVLDIPLLEAQGTVIFLFFIWITSSQAILTLTRLRAVASWKVSGAMLLTMLFVVFVYLFAVESFTAFLYPEPENVAAYFKAAELPSRLFDMMIGAATLTTILGWFYVYMKAHGRSFKAPGWITRARIGLYVLVLNRLYVDERFERAGRVLASTLRRLESRAQGRTW
jgi:NADH-quinone oxidoreductase subunit L